MSLLVHKVSMRDFGAIGDGKTINTVAFQKAIDSCHGASSLINVEAGKYVLGTVFLKSNLEFHLCEGAELLGSLNLNEYSTENTGAIEAPAFDKCLIFAENLENIKITGPGIINGRGASENFPEKNLQGKICDRPMLMRFVNCKEIYFTQVTLKDAASWCVHMVDCTNIVAEKMFISSHVNTNNDGFDLDGCENVLIEHCSIDSGDDSICPKSTTQRVCNNYVVKNCKISSGTAAFKLGTSSLGGFRNMHFLDCEIFNCTMGVIKLLLVDGGIMEDIHFSRLNMQNVAGPIFIRLGNRGRSYNCPTEQVYDANRHEGHASVGSIRGITLKDIKATVTSPNFYYNGIMITGIPHKSIENIELENIEISFPGGFPMKDFPQQVPEDESRYPEQFFFGNLPSWGAYLRHINNISFKNVRLSTRCLDERSRIIVEDVEVFSET